MRHPALLLALAVALPCAATAASVTIAPKPQPASAEASTGLLHGRDHAFYLTAPAGWILDTQAGRADGLSVVFYPAKTQWATAPVVMYAVGVPEADDAVTVDSFLADNVARVQAHAPKTEIATAPDLETSDGRAARVLRLTREGSHETVAFIRERRSVVVVTMTARTAAAFAAARPAFEAVVASYQYLGENVTLSP